MDIRSANQNNVRFAVRQFYHFLVVKELKKAGFVKIVFVILIEPALFVKIKYIMENLKLTMKRLK